MSLQAETGGAQAVRLITYTETPAQAVLAALVAAQIVGRGRLSVHLALGIPALLITLLSFSRDALIVLGVTVAIALLATLGWMAIRRLAVLAAVARRWWLWCCRSHCSCCIHSGREPGCLIS